MTTIPIKKLTGSKGIAALAHAITPKRKNTNLSIKGTQTNKVFDGILAPSLDIQSKEGIQAKQEGKEEGICDEKLSAISDAYRKLSRSSRSSSIFSSRSFESASSNSVASSIKFALGDVDINLFKSSKHKFLQHQLDQMVSSSHQSALTDNGRAANKMRKYVFSIRETGSASLKRIQQGAKPKPHTILEKTIKEGSIINSIKKTVFKEICEKHDIKGIKLSSLEEIDEADSTLITLKKEFEEKLPEIEERAAEMLKILEDKNLDGFVGHWQDDKLIGVRVDDYKLSDTTHIVAGDKTESPASFFSNQGIQIEDVYGKDKNGKDEIVGSYIPINLEDPEHGFENIEKLHGTKENPNSNWQGVLYSGDYDLHEIYSRAGGSNGQIIEGSREMANFITQCNDAIAKDGDSFRKGKATVDNDRIIHVEGSYGMVRHGPQSTYRANQINETKKEAEEANPGMKYRPGERRASLVKSVANESDEPLAWLVKGEWYVTSNKEEHQLFRDVIGVKAPSTWQDESRQRQRIENVLGI